jgi:hypothetical protein
MRILTPEERALLTQRLAEAEQALHDVALGGKPRVFVDQNGERIEYGPTSTLALQKYIFQLQSRLGIANSTGPAHVWLGC